MAELITGGDGTAHVSSADDGALFASIVGTGSYAGKGVGEGLPLTVKDANHLTLGTGCAWHNGRGIRVPAQEEVIVESGAQAMRRWDKVVLRYTRGVDGVEAVNVHVIKGEAVAETATPAYPPHETGSVLDGAEVSDMPIWGVKVNGITIEGTERLFSEVPSLSDAVTVADSVTTMAVGSNAANKQRFVMEAAQQGGRYRLVVADNAMGLYGPNWEDLWTQRLAPGGVLPVSGGGTGAVDGATALSNMGLKSWLLNNVFRVGYVWVSYVKASPSGIVGGTWAARQRKEGTWSFTTRKANGSRNTTSPGATWITKARRSSTGGWSTPRSAASG